MAKRQKIKPSIQQLQANYDQLKSQAESFMIALRDQFEHLLHTNNITLGVPIECRVKTWDSIYDSIERNKLSLSNIIDLDDLVGIRLILLFRRDLDKIHELINNTFNVTRYEDTSTRLTETQFGYQSVHYVITLPNNWLEIPSFLEFGKFQAELQVRTLAQHIWAAASHKLQYKQESSVPLPIMRSIYRVSAILETVDLEFERVLNEREFYIAEVDTSREDVRLNADVLQTLLDELLPPSNKSKSEPYGQLVEDLLTFDIDTVGKLRQLIQSYLPQVLEEDKQYAKSMLTDNTLNGDTKKRVKQGIFFMHVGLVRQSLGKQFGEKWEDYLREAMERRRHLST